MPDKKIATTKITLDKPEYEKFDLNQWAKDWILTPEKVEILQHQGKQIIMISAKNTGKTIVAVCHAIYVMNNFKAYAAGIRKWKSLSGTQLKKYFKLAADHLESYGVKMFPWHPSQTSIVREVSNKNKLLNNEFLFGSLENLSDFDGNPSKIMCIVIDEPILASDTVHYRSEETKKEELELWNASIQNLKDNCFRHNSPEESKFEKVFFLCNPWDKNHPVPTIAERIFPEKEFFDKMFLGRGIDYYIGNNERIDRDWGLLMEAMLEYNTDTVYDAETDYLVVRQNKFANPNVKKDEVFKSIYNALINGQTKMLVALLGLADDSTTSVNLVFGELDYKFEEFDNIPSNAVIAEAIHSVDIDTSRVLTLTTGIRYVIESRVLGGDNLFESKILILPQIEIKADGSGAIGEKNGLYVQQIRDTIERQIKDYKLFNVPNNVLLDDKRKWFSYELNKDKPICVRSIQTFQQHGVWDLEARQNIWEQSVNKGILRMSRANQSLIQDTKTMVRADIYNKKRETKGNINYLDRYDSAEQITTFWSSYVLNPIRKRI